MWLYQVEVAEKQEDGSFGNVKNLNVVAGEAGEALKKAQATYTLGKNQIYQNVVARYLVDAV